MKMTDYLEQEGITRTELSKRLGVSKAAVGKWDEIPENHMQKLDEKLPDDVAYRDWWVRDDRLFWRIMNTNGTYRIEEYGHGSEHDYEYSMGKIGFIRDLVKNHGISGTIEWVHGVNFPSQFIHDVAKDCVCPNVVDMRKPTMGGKPVPKRVFPFGAPTDSRS